MSRNLSILILDLGLILLAISTVIYWKMEKDTYQNFFWDYSHLNWMPYLGAVLAIVGFVLLRNTKKS